MVIAGYFSLVRRFPWLSASIPFSRGGPCFVFSLTGAVLQRDVHREGIQQVFALQSVFTRAHRLARRLICHYSSNTLQYAYIICGTDYLPGVSTIPQPRFSIHCTVLLESYWKFACRASCTRFDPYYVINIIPLCNSEPANVSTCVAYGVPLFDK